MSTVETFANSLALDQDQQNIGPDLDPNHSVPEIIFQNTFIIFFLFQNKLKKNLSGILSVSNRLDPDQAPCFVWSDLGPNCLQRLSTDNKSPLAKKDLRFLFILELLIYVI